MATVELTKDDHQHIISSFGEVAPTCTESGTKAYYKCADCEKLFADETGTTEIQVPESIEPLGHSFTNYVSDDNATCIADGTKTAKCDRCIVTDTVADTGSVKGHSFTSYVSDSNASCEADGTKTAKCDNCDETDTVADTDSATGHSYGDAWQFDENNHWHVCANGCEIKGDVASHIPNIENATENESKYCTICNHVIQEALGHTEHNYTIAQYDETHHWNKCYGCNAIDEKIEHSYSENIVTSASCTTSGEKTLSCSCGYSRNETISALGHSEQQHDAQEPTCTAVGWDDYVTCSRCSYTTYVEKEALDHAWDSGVVTTAATCTSPGIKTFTCLRDAEHITTETVEIDANAHKWGAGVVTDPTCAKKGYTTYTCEYCGDTYTDSEVAPLGHTWTDNVCTICNAVKFEAECSEVTQDSGFIGTDNRTLEAANYPSGGLLISGMKNASEFKTVFNVYSDTDTEAELTICLGLREWSMNVARVLKVTVNGVEVEIDSALEFPVYSGENQWFDWYELDVATINLSGGRNNVIVIEKREGLGDGNGNGLNFDYISLCGDGNIQWMSEVSKGHTYEWNLDTVPTRETEGSAVCSEYCTTCRLYKASEIRTLPAISAENGYQLVSENSVAQVWSYELPYGGSVEIEVSKPTQKYSFTVDYNDPFATENGGDADGLKAASNATYGTYYEGSYGKTFTVSIYVEEATDVKFYLNVVTNRAGNSTNGVTDISLYNADGNLIENAVERVYNTIPQSASWALSNATDVHYATISLQKGINVIKFTRLGTNTDSNNINIAGVSFESIIPVTLASEEITYTFMCNDNDPFAAANGGSFASGASYTCAYVSGYYQNTYNGTFTTSVYVEEATTVKFYVRILGRSDFDDYNVVNTFGTLTSTGNEGANNVTMNTSDEYYVWTNNWNLTYAVDAYLAEIELQAGYNEITFTRGTTNVNISGIKIASEVPVTLGVEE